MIEASNEAEFTYQNELENGEVINAVAPLTYAIAESSSSNTNSFSLERNKVSEVQWKDLYSNEYIDLNSIEKDDYNSDGIMTLANSDILADSTYVNLYNKIYGMQQSTNTCTSTAAAILLRYYNMTKSENGGVTKKLVDEDLRNALLKLMGTTVRIEKYMSSMDTWFSDINYTVSTYAWTTSYDYQNTSYSNIKFVSPTRKTDYFSTYKGLIDVSSPAILVVGKNMLSYLSGSQLHSVVGYGY